MAFPGWLQLAGTEIVNNQRVSQYARHMAPELIPECDDCPSLAEALNDGEYRSPALDEAPWWDAEVQASSRFAGFYALEVSGLEDDSREAPVFQSAYDGGSIGRVRRATKEIRVTGLLIAEDGEGLSFGIEWLKNALNGSECPDSTRGCAGDDLCFLSACPDIPEGAVDPEADPVEHQVSLGPWEVSGGSWLNGRWQLFSTPQTAIGPSLGDLPCDEVTLAFDLEPREGVRVRLYAVDEDSGGRLIQPVEATLQRTNWARNPSFSTGTETYWTSGPDTELDATPDDPGHAEVTTQSEVSDGDVLAVAEGAAGRPGQPYSGRLTVEISSEGLVWNNVVPNPSVRTLGGFDEPDLVRDTDVFFVDSGSARMDVPEDDTEAVGPINYGEEDDQYAIHVDSDETYQLSAYVRSSVDAQARLIAQWLDEDGDSDTVGYFYVPIEADTWVRLEESGGPPGGASRLILGIEFVPAEGGSLDAGDAVYVDALMVSPQSPLVSYFDGDSEDAFWEGLPHSSPSVLSPSSETACVQLGIETADGVTMGPSMTAGIGDPVDLEVSGALVSTTGAVTLQLFACGEIPAGTALRVSQALLERSDEPGEYFDGNVDDTSTYEYRWLGAPGLAPSVVRLQSPFELTVPLLDSGIRPAIDALEGDLIRVNEVTASYRPAADPFECADQYERTIREVACTGGPTILEEFDTCDGRGRMWRVEFFLTAGVPWVWQLLRPEFEVLPGSTVEWSIWEDDCTDEQVQPINDPDCPLPPAPPRPPAIMGCTSEPSSYRRRSVLIPGDVVAPSQAAVPILSIEVDGQDAARQTRIRFYANPLSRENLDDLDPCGYCGEFVITYIPGGATMILDGMTESAVVEQGAGVRRPASHLLRSSSGGPMQWPLLTCGIAYTMTVDVSPFNVDVITTNVELAARS